MPHESGHRLRIVVTADPDPGLLVSIAGVIRLSNRLPSTLKVTAAANGLAVVEIEIDGVDRDIMGFIQRKLERLAGVCSVQ